MVFAFFYLHFLKNKTALWIVASARGLETKFKTWEQLALLNVFGISANSLRLGRSVASLTMLLTVFQSLQASSCFFRVSPRNVGVIGVEAHWEFKNKIQFGTWFYLQNYLNFLRQIQEGARTVPLTFLVCHDTRLSRCFCGFVIWTFRRRWWRAGVVVGQSGDRKVSDFQSWLVSTPSVGRVDRRCRRADR